MGCQLSSNQQRKCECLRSSASINALHYKSRLPSNVVAAASLVPGLDATASDTYGRPRVSPYARSFRSFLQPRLNALDPLHQARHRRRARARRGALGLRLQPIRLCLPARPLGIHLSPHPSEVHRRDDSLPTVRERVNSMASTLTPGAFPYRYTCYS